MRVLTIGATGYLGGGAARALQAAGHTVAGTARSAEAGAKLEAAGYEAVDADVARPETLAEAAKRADATIYAVEFGGEEAAEAAALQAIARAMAGSNKPFVYTSGVWYYGATGDRVADESWPGNPLPPTMKRPRLEKILFDAAQDAVRSIVVRPGIVYGHARGLPAMFVEQARERGVALTVGDGSNHWPVVHVDDLSDLYVLALARGKAGNAYNATDESAFTQQEIARAASAGAGRSGATAVWPLEEAMSALGAWAQNLALDQRASSARAKRELSWTPKRPSLLEDLARGSYARAAVR